MEELGSMFWYLCIASVAGYLFMSYFFRSNNYSVNGAIGITTLVVLTFSGVSSIYVAYSLPDNYSSIGNAIIFVSLAAPYFPILSIKLKDTISFRSSEFLFVPTYLPLLITLISLPVVVFVFDGQIISQEKITIEEFDVKAIEQKLENIKLSFNKAENKIREETRAIDKTMDAVLEEINKKNNVLINTKKETKRIQAEIEQYKALASLTESQIKSVVSALDKGKYIDYFIGLLSGMFSSLLVYWITTHRKTLTTKKANK